VLGRAVAGRRLAPKECQSLADRLVPAAQSWAYNQTLFDIGVLHCRSGVPRCEGCPLRGGCAWASGGWTEPDPGAPKRRQSPFVGSDRQGRGRLVEALRKGVVAANELAAVCGWADDERARHVADGLVRDGLAVWSGSSLELP